MNELTQAIDATFELVADNLHIFVGIPLMCFTIIMAVNLVKVMCQPRRRIMTERISVPEVTYKKLYVPPVLHLHYCPVSSCCDKCRFCGTDRCLKSYL